MAVRVVYMFGVYSRAETHVVKRKRHTSILLRDAQTLWYYLHTTGIHEITTPNVPGTSLELYMSIQVAEWSGML